MTRPYCNFLTGSVVTKFPRFSLVLGVGTLSQKKRVSFICASNSAAECPLRTLWTLVRILLKLERCLFTGMAFARVIVLNIRKPNGVSCPGFTLRLFFRAAGLLYSVPKWNARPDPSTVTRVLLPIYRLSKQGHCKWVCNSIVNGLQ